MRRPDYICVRAREAGAADKLTGELEALLACRGRRVNPARYDAAEGFSPAQLRAAYPEADIILLVSDTKVECPTIYLVGSELEIPEDGREQMIAIAANGDTRRSQLALNGCPAEILDRDDPEGIADFILELKAGRASDIRCRSKLMLSGDFDFFGPGIAQLLHSIDETGSIRKAAIAMEMSYSKAWKMIGKAENATGILFLERVNGGKAGGNSVLTEDGRLFLTTYDRMTEELRVFCDQLNDRYLKDLFE